MKILSFVIGFYYTNNKIKNSHTNYQYINEQVEIENKICISPAIHDFMMCWINFTIEISDYSKAIIRKYNDEDVYYNNLKKTKDELISLFYQIYKESGNEFNELINKEIIYKKDLCKATLYNNLIDISKYSEAVTKNTMDLINLFIKINKNKQNQEKLKLIMKSHTETYIKSVGLIKNITNSELTRELVLGSIHTVKLLFV